MRMRPRVVLVLLLIPALSATPRSQARAERLPALQFTELIQGAASDVGTWGDGRVYVVDLWGTWCPPCIRSIPELTKLQRKYGARGLVVIGYSWEDPARVRSLVARLGDDMRYTLVNDRQERFLKIVAEERELVHGFPFTFVIDRNGEVAWSGTPDERLDPVVGKALGSSADLTPNALPSGDLQ
jgi:thiol-disulfide isomerase/thioredoxin